MGARPAVVNVAWNDVRKALADGESAGPDWASSNTPHCSIAPPAAGCRGQARTGCGRVEAAASAAQTPRKCICIAGAHARGSGIKWHQINDDL